MSNLVSQHQQASFSTPVNGTVNDATVVLSNDNATVTTYNSHDADYTIHVQQSTAAARPAFGTLGRLWFTNDDYVMAYDTGAAWQPLKIAASSIIAGTFGAGNYVFPANLTVTGVLSGSSTLTIAGASAFNGNVTFGDATSDTVTVTGRIASTITWATDNTYDLGASGANRPRDFFLARNAVVGGTLDVTGTATFAGAVNAGSVTGGTVTATGGLTVSAGTAAFGATTITHTGAATLANGLGADLTLGGAGADLTFFGGTPTAKLTVTGSRGGNAALADLLSQLAAYGLLTDGTSA